MNLLPKTVFFCLAFAVASSLSVQARPQQSTTFNTTIKSSKEGKLLADKIVQAYGGADKLANLNELTYKGKGKVTEFSMLSGAANTFDCVVYSKGEKTRVELNLGDHPIVTGFDGVTSWVLEGSNVMPADKATSKHVKEEIEHGLYLLDKITSKQVSVAVGQSKTVNGQLCPCLRVEAPDGKVVNFYCDPKSYLVSRSEYFGADLEQGLDTLKGYEYSDYKRFSDTYLPLTTIEYNADKKSATTILSELELVASAGDDLFQVPNKTEITSLKNGPVQVPFDFRGNEIIVKTKLNGTIDAQFILDTGATQTVMNEAAASKFANLQKTDYRMTTGSGSIPASYATLKSLALGDAVLPDVGIAIGVMPGFNEIPGAKPVGLLGANFLRHFLITIDYQNKLITLDDPKNVKVPAGATVLPTKPALGTSGIAVEGKLDNHPLTFLVDTGAAFNNASQQLIQSFLSEPLLAVGTVEGLEGQKINIGSVMFKTLKIGDFVTTQPVFTVAPKAEGSDGKNIISSGSIAILGNGLWSQFRMTVDYQNQRLILEQPPQAKALVDARTEIDKIDLKYKKTFEKTAAAKQFHQSATNFEHHNFPAAAALCLSKAAWYDSLIAAEQKDPASMEIADKEFSQALQLANSSKNPAVKAEVGGRWGLAYLCNNQPPKQDLAKEQLAIASINNPLDATVIYALHKYTKMTGSDKTAKQLLDQTLLFDPSNWDALWERLEQAQSNQKERRLVIDQLNRYYPGVPKVIELVTKSGG